MKIRFLATPQSPDYYTFGDKTVIAHYNGQTETIDLTSFDEGAQFNSIEFDNLPLNYMFVMQNVKKENNELFVTLCQKCESGNWTKSDWINSSDYIQGHQYIKEVTNNG
jgi:hypothetical protein